MSLILDASRNIRTRARTLGALLCVVAALAAVSAFPHDVQRRAASVTPSIYDDILRVIDDQALGSTPSTLTPSVDQSIATKDVGDDPEPLPSWDEIYKILKQFAKEYFDDLFKDSSQCGKDLLAMANKTYPHSTEMLNASAKGLADWGDFLECEKYSQAETHFCMLTVAPKAAFFLGDGSGALAEGMCLPPSCQAAELNVVAKEAERQLKIGEYLSLSVACAPRTRPALYKDPATLMLVIVLAALVTCVVCASILFWIMDKHESIASAKLAPDNTEEPPPSGAYRLLEEGGETRPRASSTVNASSPKGPSGDVSLKEWEMISSAVSESKMIGFRKSKDVKARFVQIFALQLAFETLLKPTTGDFVALQGIRTIAMFWVLLGHTYIFMLGNIKNVIYVFDTVVKGYIFQLLLNATISVDVFFYIGGFVVALALHGRLKKGSTWSLFGLAHVHRVLRLLPMFAFTLFIYWKLSVYLPYGPRQANMHATADAQCANDWWKSLLFIGNITPGMEVMCTNWGWYLMVDMQLFIFTPLLLLVYHKSKWVGYTFALLVLAAGIGYGSYLVVHHDMSMVFLTYGVGKYMSTYYGNTFARSPPYMVGIITYYIYCDLKNNKIKLHWVINWTMFIIGGVIMWFILFCTYGEMNDPKSWNSATHHAYTILARFMFTVGLALWTIVFAQGSGGIFRAFLSHYIWHPMAKLSYGAYLVHCIILFTVYGSMKAPYYYDDVSLLYTYMGNVVLTFTLALIMFLIVERPFSVLQKILLPA